MADDPAEIAGSQLFVPVIPVLSTDTGVPPATGTVPLGEKVTFNAVTPDAYRSFGFPGADDLGNMFQFTTEFEAQYCGALDVEFSRSLNPSLQSFAQWLDANKASIPLD